MELQEAPGEREAGRYNRGSYPGTEDCQGRGEIGVGCLEWQLASFVKAWLPVAYLGPDTQWSHLKSRSPGEGILSTPGATNTQDLTWASSCLEVSSRPTLRRPLLKEGSSHRQDRVEAEGEKQITDTGSLLSEPSLAPTASCFRGAREQTRKIIVVERLISNVWSPFYNHSLGPHYGNFSSITGKLYNESDDKPASKAKICILIHLLVQSHTPPLQSLRGQRLSDPGSPGIMPSQLCFLLSVSDAGTHNKYSTSNESTVSAFLDVLKTKCKDGP